MERFRPGALIELASGNPILPDKVEPVGQFTPHHGVEVECLIIGTGPVTRLGLDLSDGTNSLQRRRMGIVQKDVKGVWRQIREVMDGECF